MGGNNDFMQNKNFFTKNVAFNAHNNAGGGGGEYEYEIDLPNQNKGLQNIGESIGSNPNSVAGHYNDNQGSQININGNYNGLVGNINVKKSMLKLGQGI